MNLYSFTYNALLNHIDYLGLEPQDPPINLDPIDAGELTTEENREVFQRQFKRSHPKFNRNRTQQEHMRDVLRERDGEPQIKELHDPHDFDNGFCECPQLWLRMVKSHWGGGREGDWTMLEIGGGFRVPHDVTQEYKFRLQGGSCDSYSVTLTQSLQQEDRHLGRFFPLPRSHVQDSPIVGRAQSLEGMAHKHGKHGSILAPENTYKFSDPASSDPASPGGEVEKRWRVLVQIKGKLEGVEGDCCVKTYVIYD